MSDYPFKEIERKWQQFWESSKTFRTPVEVDTSKPKFYVLDMFPYPSGVGLHVGHPLGYIATDILARYKRARGYNVLHPMGFDAFGLPAEQFAVEHGVHPRITTEKNIDTMMNQLKSIGLSYDWDRQFSTTDVDYYRWTQWIFLKLYNSYYDQDETSARPIQHLIDQLTESDPDWSSKSDAEKEAVLSDHRLAYIADVPVNWCPALGTVLANEEVTHEGRSERGNHPVYKRALRQWMLRITAYADRLDKDLEDVDWPEPIKLMQRNWVGRSQGAYIDFSIPDSDEKIRVFTTRPDTLFGATYMVLAPEHPLVDVLTTDENRDVVNRYRTESERRTEIDRMTESKQKTGVPTGGFVINPAHSESIPVWIADYVLMGYGTGAIMAVPGQDERDWEFAEVFDLPIIRTVQPPNDFAGKAFLGEGRVINSGFLDGLEIDEAKKAAIAWLEETGSGEGTTIYKLRDWLFSRQRYWGEPFPILYGPDGSIRTVPETDLPVELPEMDDFRPAVSDDPDAPPRPPLSRAPESWRYVELDGVRYERELNTMPQWAGSCWYYLRFIDNKNADQLVAPEKEAYWMSPSGIDLYIGGVEHAVLHLLYARFWHKVLMDLGHVSTKEPFGKLFNQGYILAPVYRDERGLAVEATDVVDQDGHPAVEVQDQPNRLFTCNGQPVSQEYGKMGKSLKNAVSPDEINDEYGCDTLRLYEMYMGPLDASKPWSTRDIIGVNRFLRRVWRNFVGEDGSLLISTDAPSDELERALHKTIQRVTDDYERMSFNTAIAALIEFMPLLVALNTIPRTVAEVFILLLAPLAPHVSEELWSKLGHEESLAYEPWPTADERFLVEDTVTIAVQVNGRVRASIQISPSATEADVVAIAKSNENVARFLDGKEIKREIYVPGRIVNLVVGE
ncbi:MAG: leucine--tRNA ligase [Bacteroidetes bacterium]|nr:leucine--tRNA ligase [Bacteroidota bacterium]